LKGAASITHNGATAPLKIGAPVFIGDLLQTGPAATLGVTFDDETTFNLSENASITVDEFVYQASGARNSAAYNVIRGTVAFVAQEIAKTGDMRISTPTATLGIRGTTGVVEIPPGTTPTGIGDVSIKLYPDADGKVGRIEVFGERGRQLGILARAATGFSVRGLSERGPNQQVAVSLLSISPQEATRDRAFVRQVFAARTAGQRFIAERRNLRLQRGPAIQQRPELQQRPGLQPRRGLQAPQQPPGLQRLQRDPSLQRQRSGAQGLPYPPRGQGQQRRDRAPRRLPPQ
jgi:hypothetical protein